MIDTNAAAAAVARLHRAQGGCTFSLHDGDRAGQALFAVSLFPERTRRFRGSSLPTSAVARYIERNQDLLQDTRISLGTWFDADQGVTYLDVSLTLPDRVQAEELARRYNQIGIFDLREGRWIATGGTGEAVDDLQPEIERLPPA